MLDVARQGRFPPFARCCVTAQTGFAGLVIRHATAWLLHEMYRGPVQATSNLQASKALEVGDGFLHVMVTGSRRGEVVKLVEVVL